MADVKLPPLGEGVDTGTVVSILVKEGDQITQGQNVIELETGKAVAPIPSSAAGTVTKISVSEGAKISVGQTILSLSGDARPQAKGKETPPAAKPDARTPAGAAEPAAAEEVETSAGEEAGDEAPSDSPIPPPASPSLRRLAKDMGIDLRKIKGSENGGRIVLGDLRTYIQRLQKQGAAGKAPMAEPGVKSPAPSMDFSKWGQIAKRPMTPLRKVISQRMAENWNAIPHVTQFEEVDLTRVMDLRKQFGEAYEKQGAKLTLTPFILKAVAKALKAHPAFNSSLDEAAEEIVYKEYYHIGLAVDTEQGLIVPVIRDVDKKNLLALSKEVNELAEKTRDRKVSMEDLQGGSFTVSNQGGIGGGHFTPIVNKPEVAILGVGRGALKPVVRDKNVEVRFMLPVALSYDHRVIDGGSAVRFVMELAQALENFPEEEVRI